VLENTVPFSEYRQHPAGVFAFRALSIS